MKLYSGPLSLYSRKVEIALALKRIACERVMVPFSQTTGYNPKSPHVLRVNPKGQVPVLIDGPVALYDSTVILEYVEDAYPSQPLLPAAPAERAACRILELYADEIMIVPLRELMHRTTPGGPDTAGWVEAEARAKDAEVTIAGQYAHVDDVLSGRPFFCASLGIADIALFMGVLFGLRLGGPSLQPHRGLAAWFGGLLQRPPFANVLAEVRAADAALSRAVPGAYAGLDPALFG